jgi:hypothetical protein
MVEAIESTGGFCSWPPSSLSMSSMDLPGRKIGAVEMATVDLLDHDGIIFFFTLRFSLYAFYLRAPRVPARNGFLVISYVLMTGVI